MPDYSKAVIGCSSIGVMTRHVPWNVISTWSTVGHVHRTSGGMVIEPYSPLRLINLRLNFMEMFPKFYRFISVEKSIEISASQSITLRKIRFGS